MVAEWKWETAVPELSPITEGPAWDGRYLWFVYTAIDGIMRFDPETGEYEVVYYQSNGCGGLTFDAEGRLYGAEGGTRRSVNRPLRRPAHSSLREGRQPDHHHRPAEGSPPQRSE